MRVNNKSVFFFFCWITVLFLLSRRYKLFDRQTYLLINLKNPPNNNSPNLQTTQTTLTSSKVPKTTKKVVTVAKTLTCKSIGKSALSNVKTTKYGIPLIMHQIYKDPMVPMQYIPLVESCRRVNPDFVHLMWTDDVMNKFINTVYPHYKSLFVKYVEGAQKADFFRVLLLYHFGGVYIDMDVECKKPLFKELDQFNSSAILDQERWLQTRLRWNKDHTAMNSAMMSRKGHPFFKYLLDKFPSSLNQGNVMWRTGPFFVHDRFEEYQRQKRSNHSDLVYLAPAFAFSPLLDPSLFGLFNGKCAGNRNGMAQTLRLGCDEWIDKQKRRQDNQKELESRAIMIHRFMHLAYNFMKGAIKKRVDICEAIPTLSQFGH